MDSDMKFDAPATRRIPAVAWWIAWAFVGLLWIFQAPAGYDWGQIVLGILTGGILALWATDMNEKAHSSPVPRSEDPVAK